MDPSADDVDSSADDVLEFPVPAWLAAHCEPNIEAIVELLGPDMQQRYRRCLAEEVRSPRPGTRLPACLRALTRAMRETEALNRKLHPECWPR